MIPAGAHGRAVWDKTRAMLCALLADRFHLVIRRGSKEMSLYEISVAKNGPKLTKSTRDCSADIYMRHGFSGNPRRLSAMGVDMADLASELTGFAGRPVLDKTGITGEFDFLLPWNPFYGRQRPTQTPDDTPRPPARNEGPMPDIDSLPDLGTALGQQLGLKLESRKGPVETYVIVSVERPSENPPTRNLRAGSFLESTGGMRSPGICGVCGSAAFGEAAHEFLAPHILWDSEGGQKLIDRAEVAAAKMRVRHRFDGFQLFGWVCFQIRLRGLHLCVPKP